MESDLPLNFLKFSTAGSGGGIYNKVIFLVFKKNAKEPFLVIKTVRKYSDKKIITTAFQNLNNLNKIISGSKYEKMFPRALYVYDDTDMKMIFSIETACRGIRMNTDDKNLHHIINHYFNFQKYLSEKENNPPIDLLQYFATLINQLNFEHESKAKLASYFKNMYDGGKIRTVRAISQHGDLTADNAFLENGGLCLVDCDLFGAINLTGFDLFHLLIRCGGKNFKAHYRKYFKEYFHIIGDNILIEPHLLFIYYIQDLVLKKIDSGRIGVDEILDGFKKLL